MPLTVDCACEGVGRKVCEIQSLAFVVTDLNLPYGQFELRGGPSSIGIGAAGSYDLSPVSTWIAALPDLYVWMKAERSLNSNDLDPFSASFYLQASFTCVDSEGNTSESVLQSANTETDYSECVDEDFGTLRAFASLAKGGIAGAIIHSSSLASCFGFEVQGGNFDPLDNLQVVDLSDADSEVCLCVSGGTAPYVYVLTEGNLPSGVTLNRSTGCLTGTPDGQDAGTEKVTIRVFDASRPSQEASITCKYVRCNRTEIFGNDQY